MINRVLDDYKEKLKHYDIINSLFTAIIVIFIFYKWSRNYSVVLVIPYLLAVVIHDISEFKKDKVFYIIPLDLNDRREYYKITFLINLIIPEVMGILIGIVLMLMGILEFKFFIFILISLGMYIVCKNLDIMKYHYNNREFYWYGVSMLACKLLAFANLAYAIGYCSNGEYYEYVNIFMFILIFTQLAVLGSVLRYGKNIIEFIINPS